MARIRSIKPDFFRHAELYDAERKAKLPLRIAFAGLWTAADREGRFKWEPRVLKLDCLPHDDVDFSKVLDALWESGFIIKYQVDGSEYGAIPSWKDHQHINAREAESKLPEPSEECTCMHMRAHGEGKGREREGKGTDISTRDASVDADFENFKKEYPKRGAANPWQPALLLFKRAVRDGADPKAIISAATSYRHECEKNNIVNTDKVAQAQTWLRQERWRDYKPAAPVETVPGEFLVKRYSQDQTWRAEYGPEPGKPGCRSSPEVLAKFGYEPKAA